MIFLGRVSYIASLYINTIALAKYELALFVLENKVSNITTLATGHNFKTALERIPYLQQRKVPTEPEFFSPISIFSSLTKRYNDYNAETIVELRSLVVYHKSDLSDINLNGVILQGSGTFGVDYNLNNSNFTRVALQRAALDYNLFRHSQFIEVDFWGAKMHECDLAFATFVNSRIDAVDFSGSNLCGATFIDTNYYALNFTGANLVGVDLSRIPIPQYTNLKNLNVFHNAYYNSKPLIPGYDINTNILIKLFPGCLTSKPYQLKHFESPQHFNVTLDNI